MQLPYLIYEDFLIGNADTVCSLILAIVIKSLYF